jgi:hypothetical protein
MSIDTWRSCLGITEVSCHIFSFSFVVDLNYSQTRYLLVSSVHESQDLNQVSRHALHGPYTRLIGLPDVMISVCKVHKQYS